MFNEIITQLLLLVLDVYDFVRQSQSPGSWHQCFKGITTIINYIWNVNVYLLCILQTKSVVSSIRASISPISVAQNLKKCPPNICVIWSILSSDRYMHVAKLKCHREVASLVHAWQQLPGRPCLVANFVLQLFSTLYQTNRHVYQVRYLYLLWYLGLKSLKRS